ncbi:MAG: excinuclease ABC subunit UvrB, partial [Bacteroidales bacterium]|nr:excinuclease ABC subunit UvrB [Bacteroidales bacterium]
KPTGDQPQAIRELTNGLLNNQKHQTLLGVTGSGKTFTVANVIKNAGCPTLVLSHNKTLAAQLYAEFKAFFPNNAVEYFVSYYDYYQPEAYLPTTDTYIEKDLAINDEIERLRLSATSALLSGRKDVIVVCSVSCIYGIGNPEDFHAQTLKISRGDNIGRDNLLRKLVDALYFRSDIEFKRSSFRVKGDTVDVFLAHHDMAIRISFWDDEVEDIYSFDPYSGAKIEPLEVACIYPANIFVTTKDKTIAAIRQIQDDLVLQTDYFKKEGKALEAKRLEERVTYDMEMIKELGYCSGIENYSRYFDGRKPGARPFCLIDYFPKDFITVIDESHVTIPQIGAMIGGDKSRKMNLVNYGFRLPAALDNRPLTLQEFESLVDRVIYVSATPADYELSKSEGVIVEQIIRPTGLLDPIIEVRPTENQIDDLMNEINIRAEKDERVLVTTLTKRMAEELTKYFHKYGIRCEYIHSDVETLERVRILNDLRNGLFDVLIGVNLLREGLDLPEVSLVAIIDADKEGFLRSERSMTQTAGRAARNVNGKVIMYADKITGSMQRTIDQTNYRREKQIAYNTEHNITPKQIVKNTNANPLNISTSNYEDVEESKIAVAADPIIPYMNEQALEKAFKNAEKQMELASAKLDFLEAAKFRDEMLMYRNELERRKKQK